MARTKEKEPAAGTRRIFVRLPDALWARVRHAAIEERVSLQALLVAVLEEHLAEQIAREGRR